MVTLAAVLREIKGLRRKSDGDVYIADLDVIAKRIGKNHNLSRALWESGSLSARLLATRIVDAEQVTQQQLDSCVKDLDEWSLCDGFAATFVRPTKWAVAKCHEWAAQEPEFVRRAAFATMAQLAWQKNDHPDSVFADFLPLIEEYANDDRYYVKKAVNWALRDIGKRSEALQPHAVACARGLQANDNKTARWVGRHRMKEIGI